jgi:hypothetical protein
MTLLFSGPDIQVALKNVQGNTEAEIHNFSDDYVLGYSIEDLTEIVYEKFAVKPLLLDLDAKGIDWVEGYVPEYVTPNLSYDQQPGVKGRIYSFHIPYTGEEYLFHYMPMPPPPNPANASASKTEVVFTAGGAWHTSESIYAHHPGAKGIPPGINPDTCRKARNSLAKLYHPITDHRRMRW